MNSFSVGPKSLQEIENSKSFATQYTALILLILTFVLGAFASGAAKTRKEPTKVAVSLNAEVESENNKSVNGRLKSTIKLKDIFLAGGNTLNTAKAEAIATLFNSHDLIGEFDLNNFGCGEEQDDFCLRRELSASASLRSFLINKGVPGPALKISVIDGNAPDGVVLRLYEGE